MTAASGAAGILNGTSMASPQLAGFAAYLWALRPTLSPLQLKTILQQTPQPSAPASGAAGCDPASVSAPVLDAYAAVLGADVPGNAPARSAILDVADDSGGEGANGAFDERDVERFLDAFAESFGSQDWSRYDLNGDGTTGDDDTDPAATACIDLDMDEPPAFEMVDQTLPGDVLVAYDESAATDRDVLCYYAYSPLYVGDPDERDQLLERACCPEVEYELTELILPGDGEAWAWAINDHGVVAGASIAPGPTYDVQSFVWTPRPGSSTEGGYTVLQGESSGSRLDINNAGQVVGRSPPDLDYPVVWEGGVPLPVAGVDLGEARAINDAGDVVGIGAGGNAWHASAGTVTPIALPWPRPPVTLPVGQGVHEISNTGAIVGVRDFPPSVYGRPAFWSSAGAAPMNLGTVVSNGGTGEAFDVSDAGWVVGESRGPFNATYIFGRPLPFVWGRDGSGMEQLPALPGLGPHGSARGVNEKGEIVGKLSQDGVAPYERAVLWQDDMTIDLNTLLPPGTQFVMSGAFDINERGQIVGEGHRLPYDPDYTGHRGFVLTPRCAE